MLHKRRWQLTEVATPEDLAAKLTNYDWCGCNGFWVAGYPEYLFLNDSFPGGTSEFGVFKGTKQIESITFGWCDYNTALGYIQQILAGELATPMGIEPCEVETPAEHGSCRCCM